MEKKNSLDVKCQGRSQTEICEVKMIIINMINRNDF